MFVVIARLCSLCWIGCCYMFVALLECLFVLRGALSYPWGQLPDRSPGPGWGGPGGGSLHDRCTGPQVRGGGARGGRRGGPGERRGRLGVTLAGCQATRGGSRSSRRRSGALRAAPRVSPKTRPIFKIDGFVTDKNRFSKDSKSHPELHRASPKASQELPRVPQVTSTAPPRVPQGTPKSPWEGGGPPGHPWEDMGGILGVLGGPLGSLGVPWVPWGVMGVFGGAPGALLRSAFFEHLKLAPRAPRSPP